MDMPEPKLTIFDLDPKEIIYSWDEPGSDRHFHWAITRLENFLKKSDCEILAIPIEKKFAVTMVELRGLEYHRMARIPEDVKIWTPIIILHMPDNTHLIVDGNHRYYKAYCLNVKHIVGVVVEQEIWADYLVDLLIEYKGNSNEGFSGIL